VKRVVAMNASGTTIIGRLFEPQVTGRVVPIVGESYLHLYGGDWVLSELEEHSPEIDQVVKFAVDEMPTRATSGTTRSPSRPPGSRSTSPVPSRPDASRAGNT
jgi:hypothetical protein